MKARDGDWGSVWVDRHMGSLLIILPWNCVATNFAFVTGYDKPERDPIQWYWEGSKDMKTWMMLMAQLSDSGVTTRRAAQTDMYSWKIDCLVSDWHGWAECNTNCSGGNQTRVRKIQRHSWNDGDCKETFFQVQPCNEQPCQQPITVKAGARGGTVSNPLLLLLLARVCVASIQRAVGTP